MKRYHAFLASSIVCWAAKVNLHAGELLRDAGRGGPLADLHTLGGLVLAFVGFLLFVVGFKPKDM